MLLWKRINDLQITRKLMIQKDAMIEVNGEEMVLPVTLNYTASLVTQTIFTASRRCKVKAINGRVRVAGTDAGAVSIAFFKAATTVAVGSGTALHTGSFNLKGTADANQTLTLATNTPDLILAAGDSIGYVLTGTATAAVGNVTIHIVAA